MRSLTPVDVSILLVSYNTRDLTRAALDSVLAETKTVRYEIIAVDNASDDGSAETIRSHPAGVRLIEPGDNLGFARANNLAAHYARGRYLLLLNPDTVVLDGAIDKLVAFARKTPKARIWGGRTLFAGGSLNAASCWGRMTPWNLLCRATGFTGLFPRSELFNGEAIGGWQRDSVRRVDVVSGCFFLIERELWDGLRGFDPLFFMYGEEADLCLRAHAFSARPMITPEATIIHYGGASEKARTEKMIKLLSAKASLISRHWPEALRPLGLLLLGLWPLSRSLAISLLALAVPSAGKREQAAVWRAIWSRRAEWRSGYCHPANPAAAVPAALAPVSG